MRRLEVNALAGIVLLLSAANIHADFLHGPIERPFLPLPTGIDEIDRAIACFQRREYDQCFSLLKAATAKQPQLPPARLMLAKLHLMHNQLGSGRPVLEQAAVENPDYAEIYLIFGKLALQEGRLTDASLQFQKAASLNSPTGGSGSAGAVFQSESQAGLATVAERRQDWPRAEKALLAWLALQPQNGKARQRLGMVRFRLGEREKANEELLRATNDDSGLELAAITMARLFSEEKDLKQAEEWMERAVQQAPKDAKVRAAYAGWLLDNDRADTAKSQIDEAHRLDPQSSEIKGLLGLIAWHLGEYVEAEQLFEKLHLESPASFPACNYLALALAAQPAEAQRRRGLELAEVNLQLYPKSAEALSTVGWAEYRMNRLEDAEKALRAALASGSATSDAAYYLACVLRDRGRPEEVQRLLKMALEAPGRFKFRKEAKEWLERARK